MCIVCERIEMIKNGANPYFVKELETGYVVIGDNQHFYGYTLFLYKEHGNKTGCFTSIPASVQNFLWKCLLWRRLFQRLSERIR